MAKIQNLERLKRRLSRVPVEARKQIRKALDQSAFEIADTAHAYAPKDSGDLRRSIGYTFGAYKAENANVRGVTAKAVGSDPDLSVTVHVGDAKAYYPAFIEFGTEKMHAQPFFFPAYRANAKRAKSRIRRAVKKAAHIAVKGS